MWLHVAADAAQERCDAVSGELMGAEVRLKAAEDVGALRRASMRYADCVGRQVELLLQVGGRGFSAGLGRGGRLADRRAMGPGHRRSPAPACKGG